MNEPIDINKVRLFVEGEFFDGWKSALIEMSMTQICRAFVLSVTDDFPGNERFRRLQPGQKVELFIGNDKVCTGYITSTPIKYDAKTINVQIQGKSRTVDLVDCCSPWAAIASGGTGSGSGDSWPEVKGINPTKSGKPVKASKTVNTSWHNVSVEKIIADLCAPYGITVHCQVDIGTKLTNFTVNPGEKVFDSIGRLLRKDNLVISDDAYGNLVIMDAGAGGQCTDSLEVGKNVLSGSANFDATQLYSKYAVLGQHKGDDLNFGPAVSQDKGIMDDPSIGRYRLLVIKDTGQSSNTIAKNRAEFEKNFRSESLYKSTHTVQGWRQSDNSLRALNKMILVEDNILKLNNVLLINSLKFSLNEKGSTTEIETIGLKAYSRKANKQSDTKKKDSKNQSSWPEHM